MATIVVPKSALQVLEMTLDAVRIRANAEGEIFGSQITDAMSEAGNNLGVDRLEVLLVRTVLVRTMESLGESYPVDLLQNNETRIRLSDAIKYLRSAIESTTRLQEDAGELIVCSQLSQAAVECDWRFYGGSCAENASYYSQFGLCQHPRPR